MNISAAGCNAVARPSEILLPWIDFKVVATEAAFVEQAAITQDGDAALKALLKRVLNGSDRRRHALPPSLNAVNELSEQFPNFSPVVEFLLGELALKMSPGAAPSRLTPILLLGDPGIGKTLFAKSLATKLSVPMDLVSMSTSTSGFSLSGLDRGWGTARQGEIFNALMRQDCINPLFVLDEVDKASTEGKSNPLGPLYQLLEVETAKEFIDEFARVPINASLISWISTANDDKNIEAALLSRMRVFHIQSPNEKQMMAVVENQYRQLRQSFPSLVNQLSQDLTEILHRMSPRQAQLSLQEAAGQAALRSRMNRKGFVRLEPSDVGHRSVKKRSMGFA